jgi:hypothetical protein
MKKIVLAASALACVFGAASTSSARADDAKPDAKGAAAEAKLLTWSSDYDAAKALAAKEKKGLLVYLTPDWFS